MADSVLDGIFVVVADLVEAAFRNGFSDAKIRMIRLTTDPGQMRLISDLQPSAEEIQKIRKMGSFQ